MINEDDMYFYRLLMKQIIHQKRKDVVAQIPDRIYDGFNKEEKRPEDIESKYETQMELVQEMMEDDSDEQYTDT